MKNPLNIICISDEKDFFFYYKVRITGQAIKHSNKSTIVLFW